MYIIISFRSGRVKHCVSAETNVPLFLHIQLVKFSELTTTKLSSDNSLLKEELEMTRGQLIDAKKALASQKAQLQMESELKEESEIKSSTQKKKVWRENLVSYPDPLQPSEQGLGMTLDRTISTLAY